MAECPEFGQAAQGLAKEALSASLKYSKGGDLSINISTTDVQVVRDVVRDVVGTVCTTAVTLGALYAGYHLMKPLIECAVKRAFGGERDDQEFRDIKPGSLNVLLHCLTDERFLEVLNDYECGRLKDRLQEEFLALQTAGIKIEGVKVEILNMEEVRKTKKAINMRLHSKMDIGTSAKRTKQISKGRRHCGHRLPTLVEFIQNILQKYPDGGQILKELIQNADDAGATDVSFLFDEQSYGVQSLENLELARFQGPALYCHNNAIFKEQDWEGIRNLMKSNKKEDPLKIGRFGIGFNSVYHITDLPGIASGDTIAFLDPHEEYFRDEKECLTTAKETTSLADCAKAG